MRGAGCFTLRLINSLLLDSAPHPVQQARRETLESLLDDFFSAHHLSIYLCLSSVVYGSSADKEARRRRCRARPLTRRYVQGSKVVRRTVAWFGRPYDIVIMASGATWTSYTDSNKCRAFDSHCPRTQLALPRAST